MIQVDINQIFTLSRNVTTAFQLFQMCRFIAWLVVSIVIIQSGVHLKVIGAFEYSIFLIGLISFVWNMGMKNALIAYYPKQESKKGIFFTSVLLQLAFGIIAAIFCAFFLDERGYTILSEESLILSFMVLITGISSIPEYIMLLSGNGHKLSLYGFFIYSLQVCLIGGSALYFGDFTSLMYGYMIWLICKTLYLLPILIDIDDYYISWKLIKKILIFSWPFLIYILIGYAMEYVDGILAKRFFPIEDFSIFKYGARELPLSTILVGAMVSATIPQYLQQPGEQIMLIHRRIKRLIYLLYPLSIVLLFLSPILFPLFYNGNYLYSAKIFNIYLLVLISRIMVPQIFLIAHNKVHALSWIGLVEMLVNMTASLYFIEKLGLEGIAVGTLVAYLFQKIVLVLYLKYSFDIPLSHYLPWKEYVLFSSLLLIAFYLSHLLFFVS